MTLATNDFSKRVPDFTGFSFIMFLLAGSTPNAKAGSESVAKFIHKMCIARIGGSQFNKVAINNVKISAILPANKN